MTLDEIGNLSLIALLPLLSACSAPEDTAWSLESGRLAFTVVRHGNAEIWLAPGNAEHVNLTSHPGQDHWASWSPDGTRIAFQGWREGNRDIYVMNADGSDPVNLTSHPAEDLLPAWSPDGSRIAFFSTRGVEPGANGEFRGAIWVMNVDGSNPVRLNVEPLNSTVASSWSPDGSKIVFNRDGSIYVMNSDGSNETQLTNNPFYDGAPVFSPNGAQIAFHSQRGDSAVISVMDYDGSGQKDLTYGPVHYYPAWSPDGSMITFTSLNGDQYDILAMFADGTTIIQMVATELDERKSSWAPVRGR
jgi:TolB protein